MRWSKVPELPAENGLAPDLAITNSRRYRNIAIYATCAALALAAIFVVMKAGRGGTRRASVAPIESLAVLPLANLSGDPQQDYFADGMTDALITDLAQVRALRVISRTSAMHYRGSSETLTRISRELNVDAVIEGTVQRSGNRVRVTAKLFRGQTDAPLWAKTYERDSRDILALESDLAQSIASEIKAQLTPQERQHLSGTRSVTPEAYDAYLLGTYHVSKRTVDDTNQAINYFQQALHLEPDYAQAYTGLALGYLERDMWGRVGIGKEAGQVRANALKAIELDADLAEAHALLGYVHFLYDWDWRLSEDEYKKAIALNSNLPTTYMRYASFLLTMGREEEALAAVRRAVELDPLSPMFNCDEGRVLYRSHRYAEAIRSYERTLELDPGYALALWRMSEAYEQLGKYDQALEWAQKYEKTTADRQPGLLLKGRNNGRTGRQREAEDIVKILKHDGEGMNEYSLASIYSAMGRRDQAITELKKMVAKRSTPPWVLRDPQLDVLREDPRFRELLQQVGLSSGSAARTVM